MGVYRYLLNIAYIGKQFRGAQRQVKRGTTRVDDPSTIQGRIEIALNKLNPINDPIVYMSSRTDSGVHALNSTCHVDLYRENGMIYDPCSVTICLNKYFGKEDVPIRILRTRIVPESFNSRHNAISRTYLYRLMIAKANKLNVAPNLNYIPIEELNRCLFICTDTLDLNIMNEGARVLEGYHDYRTFMSKHSGHEEKITRKTIEYIKILQMPHPGYSIYSWPLVAEPEFNEYIFIDVYIKSSGFLYKQVRRTVASLVALAQGKITIRDIKLMLEVPSLHSWCPQIKTLPAHGLYLCEVEYAREDLDTFWEV
ncbi:unnamed protein product [Phaedon cochleariae]|uniref:tRNA pseudouridine synthase n=1 Tax=Phaedon cochleariae TaxID=80249 RepID=A0A9P0DLC5_PHACE|nr:unnamed protein product [Phaedon cochleariae]